MSTALSPSTIRLYQSAQRSFMLWCDRAGYQHPLSPKQVASYLAHKATTSGPTAAITHFAAITKLYRQAGWHLDSKQPDIQRVLRNSRKRQGTHP